MGKFLFYFSIICVFSWSCNRNSETDKFQSNRDNIVNVREKVKEIETGDVFIGSISRLYMIGEYLLISDYKSFDKLIRIFDKNNFDYITSIANKGQGPGEITNMGHIAVNETDGKFYVSDHGKLNILSYDIDSVFADTAYMPEVKFKFTKTIFPDRYDYINDTLCISRIIEPVGNSDFQQTVAKFNMLTGEITPMKYTHPNIKKKRTLFAASMEHGLYVEVFSLYDLITICSIDGDLKYNIYGPMWDSKGTRNIHFHYKVVFYYDKIIIAYSGGNYNNDEYYPTKFLVFNLNGDYLTTLDVGYKITDFCLDKGNNRIIMSLNDVMQFAYLDLYGLI